MIVHAKRAKPKTTRVFAAVLAALLLTCVPASFCSGAKHTGEISQGAAAKSITVSGSVRNAGGEPISGADVYLDGEKKPALAHVVSGDDGSFKLAIDHSGTYTVRAEKKGWTGDQSDPIELPRDANKPVELVMENSRGQSADSESKTAATPSAEKTTTANDGTKP